MCFRRIVKLIWFIVRRCKTNQETSNKFNGWDG